MGEEYETVCNAGICMRWIRVKMLLLIQACAGTDLWSYICEKFVHAHSLLYVVTTKVLFIPVFLYNQ
jgi:hypothetical protein